MKAKYFILGALILQFGCQNITGIFGDSNEASEQQTTLEGITLRVDKKNYAPGDTIRVELLNASAAALFLEGCNQLFIETKVNDEWKTSSLWECVWAGLAVKISPDSSYTLDLPAEYLGGKYRFMAPVYFNCKDDEPAGTGECDRQEVIYSKEFRVK